jgi:hypothetical protein
MRRISTERSSQRNRFYVLGEPVANDVLRHARQRGCDGAMNALAIPNVESGVAYECSVDSLVRESPNRGERRVAECKG